MENSDPMKLLLPALLVPTLLLIAVTLSGCASPTPVSPTPVATANYAGDPVVGTWDWVSPGGSSGLQVYYAFAEDGTFTRTDRRDSTKKLYAGSWSKPDDTTYALVYRGENPGFDSENLYFMNQTGRLRNDSNDFFQKAP